MGHNGPYASSNIFDYDVLAGICGCENLIDGVFCRILGAWILGWGVLQSLLFLISF